MSWPRRGIILGSILICLTVLALVVGFRDQRAGFSGSREVPEGMVYIPPGEFRMGSTGREGKIGIQIGVDELPQHKVKLKGFFIDRYEVTNQAYREFIEASGRKAPFDPHDPTFYTWVDRKPPAGQENHPVVYVTWDDADAYCRWAGKRLPTEAEWEKAARGPDARPWPWGESFDFGRCNVYESRIQWTTPVGSFPEGASPYGVHDLCGNVAEWTASAYRPYPGSDLKRKSFADSVKVARGGAWTVPYEPYSRSTNRNLAQPLGYQHRSIGFRCSKDP